MPISAVDLQILDALGHLGYFLLAIGTLRISNGDLSGWGFRFIGGAAWVGISFKIGLTSGVIWGLAFMAVDLFGFVRGVRPAMHDE
tara:strand:- start:9462 stop:9719 length:258 start_codon:yes stop_codon:yes gene_type:complete